MIRTVIFDLDDTLLWDERSVQDAFRETCAYAQSKYDLNPDELEERVRANARNIYSNYPTYEFTKMIGINPFEGLWGAFTDEGGMFPNLRELAPLYRKEAWTKGLKDLGIDDEEFGKELGETFPEKRKQTARLYEDTIQILDALQGKYQLVLLTNGSPALQQLKLELTPVLTPYFDKVVISGEFGRGKPDPAIFEHVLQLVKQDKQEVIMVGDNLDTDILGAVKTGITSVWINRKDARPDLVKPDYEIRKLMDLIPLLERLNQPTNV